MSVPPESTLADPQQLELIYNVELAECEAERDEAPQRETGTAKVLQVINSSSGDLAPVFIMRLPASGIATKDSLEARRARTPSVAAGESATYGFTSYPHA
ncbi:MAG TPA: hypothetical protein VHT00_13165 [Stellaceae bacterium]|jgi:hypothetical protein|nr:hypothetical protein [Stellaceae bacterium]